MKIIFLVFLLFSKYKIGNNIFFLLFIHNSILTRHTHHLIEVKIGFMQNKFQFGDWKKNFTLYSHLSYSYSPRSFFLPYQLVKCKLMKDKHSIFGRKLIEQQYLNCTPLNNVIEAEENRWLDRLLLPTRASGRFETDNQV